MAAESSREEPEGWVAAGETPAVKAAAGVTARRVEQAAVAKRGGSGDSADGAGASGSQGRESC
jgi:hypothetical protein